MSLTFGSSEISSADEDVKFRVGTVTSNLFVLERTVEV